MAENYINNSGLLQDINGKRLEVVDKAARDAAKANEERIDRLFEEIDDLKENGGAAGGEVIEKTGAIVVFDADPSMEITVSGDAPGSVELVHQGKNFIPALTKETITKNGVTITPMGDGRYHFKGTATANTWIEIVTSDNPLVLPAGDYVLSSNCEGTNSPSFTIEGITAAWVDKPVQHTLDETTAYTMAYWKLSANVTIDGIFWAQLELSPVPTAVEAYKGETHTVPLPVKVTAYDGINILYTKNGDVITATAYKGLKQIVGDIVDEKLAAYAPGFDSAAYNLPVLAMTGITSAMTKDNAVDLDYVYTDESNEINLSGVASVNWQGSSSIVYPEKNYTIKFDQEFEAKPGWGAQKKFCAKADWIDFSHLRNRVNAAIWGQICANRGDDPLADCPNYGAIDGFPIIIMINDEFMGVYNFNIHKDAWMSNMGSGTQEMILCADSNSAGCGFKETATAVLGTDFDVEYITDENSTDWAQTMLNDLIIACVNSDGSDLDTTIGDMLHWNRAIDYYIFTVMLRGDDMVTKNYLLHKKDNTKILFGAYDMDCTYGLSWDGRSWLNASGGMTFAQMAASHRLFELIKTYKTEELKARYKALRSSVLSEDNILTTFCNEGSKIPAALYTKDNERWPGKPNTSTNTAHQITDWYRLRCAVIDAEINAL